LSANFRGMGSSTNDSWRQKIRVPGLSRSVVCVILRLAVMIQYRCVTHRQTHRHTMTANTRASLLTQQRKLMPASRGKSSASAARRPVFSERELAFTFAVCYRPSVCLSVCLSVVCNVGAPYSAR